MKTQKDNPDRRDPWTLTQLAYEYSKDLRQCTSEFERQNCRAMTFTDMRNTLGRIAMEGRKLTPGEIAIVEEWGLPMPQAALTHYKESPLNSATD